MLKPDLFVHAGIYGQFHEYSSSGMIHSELFILHSMEGIKRGGARNGNIKGFSKV